MENEPIGVTVLFQGFEPLFRSGFRSGCASATLVITNRSYLCPLYQCCGSRCFSRIGIFHLGFRIQSKKKHRIPNIELTKKLKYLFFNPKIVTKLSEIWSRMFIPDPGSGFFSIPDPEVEKSPDPQHCSIGTRHIYAYQTPLYASCLSAAPVLFHVAYWISLSLPTRCPPIPADYPPGRVLSAPVWCLPPPPCILLSQQNLQPGLRPRKTIFSFKATLLLIAILLSPNLSCSKTLEIVIKCFSRFTWVKKRGKGIWKGAGT
jgi:hypothetical protein